MGGTSDRRKLSTSSPSRSELRCTPSLAAVVSCAIAAFCWVTWSSWFAAALISARVVAWVWELAEMSVTSPVTTPTSVTILSSASPTCPTRDTPDSIWAELALIRSPISFAASAERTASARTSEATTAKPRPASPARAASTPAFSASRLVWKAMSSITRILRAISPDDPSIAFIACVASTTTAPPCRAPSLAACTARSACAVPSAVSRTPWVITCSAAVVSCRVAAWLSVRCARSPVERAISSAKPVRSSTVPAITAITSHSCPAAAL